MSDPLGEFEHSINDVLMYLDTAFATRWREVNDERNMLLKSTEELHQVPFIELLPNFLSSGYRPSDLADCLGSEIRDEVKASFVEAMCTGLLQGIHRNDGATLYQHQTSILSESLEGKHCVITSPTGSGKTEAFLMPVLFHLIRELFDAGQIGPAPAYPPHRNDWWRGALYKNKRKGEDESSCLFSEDDAEIRQWWNARMKAKHAPFIPSHSVCQDSRKSGLRALMIYPLNALVDDQMRRLRFALDSKEMHELYNKHFLATRLGLHDITVRQLVVHRE